ncbi:Unknown protein [Striga hermonthica]|uniref:Uncharacterized protein n=1 Tax=Striga hermonthica TaxID=68872 RepID=A0A9N7NY41_STRHE|nr:Unknown protein [Striga hermonthica]
MYGGQKKNHAEHKPGGAPPAASPRISFSNDFIEAGGSRVGAYRDAPVSDFEFSVGGYSMMTADELFFKGRLLPLKEGSAANTAAGRTLRDELENGGDEEGDGGGGFSLRPPKNPAKWRGFWGLRKSNIGSKKAEMGGEKRTAGCNNNTTHDDEDVQGTKDSQDLVD